MATKEKMARLIRRWFLPALFLLAALPASAITRSLSESRVWAARDFAPPGVRPDRDFSLQTQWTLQDFNGEGALNPSIDPDGRLGKTYAYQDIGRAEGVGLFAWDTVKSLPQLYYQSSLLSTPEHFRQAVNFFESPRLTIENNYQQAIAAYHATVNNVKTQWQSGPIGQGRIEGYSGAFVASFFVGAGEARTAEIPAQIETKMAEVNVAALNATAAAKDVQTVATGSGGLFRVGEATGGNALPQTMETVLQHAEQAGVGLNGINVKIIPEAPSSFYGWAAPSGTEIHLYPSAFTDSETLVRTLAHERTHAYQFQTFGPAVNESTASAALFEEGAYGAEESFWQYFLQNGAAQ
jgi:hypothetical protein